MRFFSLEELKAISAAAEHPKASERERDYLRAMAIEAQECQPVDEADYARTAHIVGWKTDETIAEIQPLFQR